MRKYNEKISERANDTLRKREAVIRKQRTIFAIVLILLVSLGILLGTSVNALASSRADVASYNKYYTSVRIEAGDTLWTIADEYIDTVNVPKTEYIDEICQLNDIYADEICVGDCIVVPYYTDVVK